MKKSWLDEMREKKSYPRQDLIAEGHKRSPRWSDAELQPWVDAKAQVHEEVLQWMDAPAVDWRNALKQMRCPALLITGDMQGVVILPEMAAQAQSLNAQLRVAHIAGAGHCIRRDDFAAFMAAVDAFLARTA